LIAPLKHSVLYFEKIEEPGDEASAFSTVFMSLSSSNVWTYMICDVPSIQVLCADICKIAIADGSAGSLW
jgi:hypothetical protein